MIAPGSSRLPLALDAKDANGFKFELGSLTSSTGSLQNLPLQNVEAKAKVRGLDAKVKLTQEFENTFNENLEVTYTFPLPARFGVKSLTATLGGRKVDAFLKDKSTARSDYTQALKAGKRAALMEMEKTEVFTLSLGSIRPGEKATVEITLVGRLSVDNLEATFRFPSVVAPRYQKPSEELLSSNGPRVTTKQASANFEFSLDFEAAGLPVSQIASSLAPMTETRTSKGVKLTFSSKQKLDQDVIVRFPLKIKKLSSCLSLSPNSRGTGGTWTLDVFAPKLKTQTPRNLTILLDHSGSMGGWKMAAARRAAARIIDALNQDDSFNVLAFDHEILRLPGGLQKATDENRFKAVEWLLKIEAEGMTVMDEPLFSALDELKGKENSSIILITDGQASEEELLLKRLSETIDSARVFTVGIDRAVNAGFLERISEIGGGTFKLVESQERLNEVLRDLTLFLSPPALMSVALVSDDVEILNDQTLPQTPSDAFYGTPLTLRGRYRGAFKQGAKFHINALKDSEFYEEEIMPSLEEGSLSRTLWAKMMLSHLEDLYSCNRDEEVKRQAVKISLKFKVLSRFTAFIAVDEETGEAPKLSVTQPLEEPSGWVPVATMGVRSSAMPFNAVNASVMGVGARGSMGSTRTGAQSITTNAAPLPFGTPSLRTGTSSITPWVPSPPSDRWAPRAIPETKPQVADARAVVLKALIKALQERDLRALKVLMISLKGTLPKAQSLLAMCQAYLVAGSENDRSLALSTARELLNGLE